MTREMEVPMDASTVQQTSNVGSTTSCAHSRLIDDVLTRNGKRTGNVRCCECKAIFEDPYQGLK